MDTPDVDIVFASVTCYVNLSKDTAGCYNAE